MTGTVLSGAIRDPVSYLIDSTSGFRLNIPLKAHRRGDWRWGRGMKIDKAQLP